jgi:hypothetical protein
MSPSFILRNADVRERAIERLRLLNLNMPEPWAIFIAPHKQIRTLEQNAAYWRVVNAICKATGHSKNVIHTYLKKTVLGIEMAEIRGQTFEVIRSSAKVDRGEFSELIESAYELAAEMGVETDGPPACRVND